MPFFQIIILVLSISISTIVTANDHKYYGFLAEKYEQQQRYDEALVLTRRAIFKAQEAYHPAWLIRWQWQLGRIFKAQNKIVPAIAAYQQALDGLNYFCKTKSNIYQKIRPIYFELADLLLQQNSIAEARDVVEQLKTADLKSYFGDCVLLKTKSIDKIADRHTAVIYPIVLEKRLELIISLPHQDLKRITVNVGHQQIYNTVTAFNKAIQKGRSDLEDTSYLKTAQRLYNWLIRPITLNNIKTLVFVPEGILGTLSMAALHDGKQFLIEKYALAITPSLNLTIAKTNKQKKKILVAAITKATQGYAKLHYAKNEIKLISKLGETSQLLDEKFTAANFKSYLNKDNYNIVHITSHAEFASEAKASFIITQNGKIKLNELDSMIKFKQTIDLLTLSACNTAKGDQEWAALGLSGIAIKAGAISSLATLWKAHDLTTYHLINIFYQNYFNNQSKAQALQAAQKIVIDTIYHHPIYWAPLVLIGNWI
ncbi:CHAT domain-containing protein [Candidatus Marithrix sp. Canyon 246]|uniref:CHAT domain-containing protein n=1 Tax=Candidatus Marithrix sp. Canyon 246 TaxID=1827136 RepID=UPI000849EE4C|nr:CHAT domain-containing protein [Candidatus Marithrix sp. Canyon 246]